MKKAVFTGLLMIIIAFGFTGCETKGYYYEVTFQIINADTLEDIMMGSILINDNGAELTTRVVQQQVAWQLGFEDDGGTKYNGWVRTAEGINQRLIFIYIYEHKIYD